MADLSKTTNGPAPHSEEGYDSSLLPDFDHDFLTEEDLLAFANALSAPEPSPSSDDLLSPTPTTSDGRKTSLIAGESFKSRDSLFITAQNDWAPVNPPRKEKRRGDKVKGRSRKQRRNRDETREGYLYTILKWPFLGVVGAWVIGLAISYLFTRLYIWLYEHFVAWRGKRERLRRKLQSAETYKDWVEAAKELDAFLGNDGWKEEDVFAYYDSKTVKRVLEQMRRCRRRVEQQEGGSSTGSENGNSTITRGKAVEDLKALVEACVKNNFVGVENSRLYSQTYYGTKKLVQDFIDEGRFLEPLLKIMTDILKLTELLRYS
jgi:hypothetical protein